MGIEDRLEVELQAMWVPWSWQCSSRCVDRVLGLVFNTCEFERLVGRRFGSIKTPEGSPIKSSQKYKERVLDHLFLQVSVWENQ
jgi:hypothetical protein